MSHRGRLNRLDSRINAPAPKLPWSDWRPHRLPGVFVQHRADWAGSRTLYTDTEEGRAAFAEFQRLERVRAEMRGAETTAPEEMPEGGVVWECAYPLGRGWAVYPYREIANQDRMNRPERPGVPNQC